MLVDPKDYSWVSQRIEKNESISIDERKKLAQKAFHHVCTYDQAIAAYLDSPSKTGFNSYSILYSLESSEGTVTRVYSPHLRLKYGINPQQVPAAIYSMVVIIQHMITCRMENNLLSKC